MTDTAGSGPRHFPNQGHTAGSNSSSSRLSATSALAHLSAPLYVRWFARSAMVWFILYWMLRSRVADALWSWSNNEADRPSFLASTFCTTGGNWAGSPTRINFLEHSIGWMTEGRRAWGVGKKPWDLYYFLNFLLNSLIIYTLNLLPFNQSYSVIRMVCRGD